MQMGPIRKACWCAGLIGHQAQRVALKKADECYLSFGISQLQAHACAPTLSPERVDG